MGLSCGYKCLQCMLVVMNAVVIALGIALIVVGSIAEVNLKQMMGTDDAYLHGIIIFVIAFGCFLTLTGMFGFCGACKKNVCCLIMYAILLAIFIVAGLAAGIAGFVLKDKLKDYTNNIVTEAYSKYSQGSDYAKAIDTIQKWLSCCGPNGTWPQTLSGPPDSCKDSQGQLHKEGCLKAVELFFEKNVLAVSLCVFLFALVLILGLVFAICVAQAIKRGEDA